MENQNEQLYTESELLSFIQGLDHVYLSKPWFIRWWWAPWHLALTTLAIQLCSNEINSIVDTKEAIGYFEDQL